MCRVWSKLSWLATLVEVAHRRTAAQAVEQEGKRRPKRRLWLKICG
jgi:hypothetical protein